MRVKIICIFLFSRPFFDQSKSQTTLNQTSLTREDAQQLSLAVTKAMRENHTSQDENSDDHIYEDNESRHVRSYLVTTTVFVERNLY